ncbi:MAG: hypothetical protein HFH14_03275 [Lachnospiraceae bacterium]|nr:hypothetical protein [Lachnospiraceae bacterium]
MSSVRTVNININANESYNVADKNGRQDNAKEKKNGNVINGARLNLADNLVAQKRKDAMNKAMQTINKTFNQDIERDKELAGRQDRIDELKRMIRDAHNRIKDADKKLVDLKQEYGIDDDSSEQKELELLMKRIDSERDNLGVELTEEEVDQLEEIDKKGLTEYQQRALQAYEPKSVDKSLIKDYEKELDKEIKKLQAAKIDDLKKAPMIKSKKDADAILEAASKEIISTLVNEAKDKIEEKAEEEKEKAEEAKEEQERLEELLNKKKEEKDITEEIPLDEYRKADDMRQELKIIVKDAGLSQEDMLGLKINQKA